MKLKVKMQSIEFSSSGISSALIVLALVIPCLVRYSEACFQHRFVNVDAGQMEIIQVLKKEQVVTAGTTPNIRAALTSFRFFKISAKL